MRRNKIAGYPFRRQQVIDGFIVDFNCHAARLIVEVDGAVHQSMIERDEERDHLLAQRGLRVIHINNSAIQDKLPAVLTAIRRLCV